MTRPLLALLLLTACGMGEIPDGDDRGGSVLGYAATIAAHEGPVVLTGYCSSACTMWLGHDEACVALPATFGFHRVAHDVTGQMQRVYESHLPAGLREWYRAHAAGSSAIVRLPGAGIIREGWARAC